MKRSNFDKIFPFSSAAGDDNTDTGLYLTSKDPQGGSDGNVGDLQRALNTIGTKPKLKVDGVFGNKTQRALAQLGYSYPVTADVFYKILGDANSGALPPSGVIPKTTVGNIIQSGLDTLTQLTQQQGVGNPDINSGIPKPPKKGLSAGAWAGIALGTVALLGGIYLIATSGKSKQQPLMQVPPVVPAA